MPPLENLPSFKLLPRRWQRIGKIQEMGVAARTAAETIAKTVVTTSSPRDRPYTGTRWKEKSDSSSDCSSSDYSRRDNRRHSHRRRKKQNPDNYAEPASLSRSTAPVQLPAPSRSRPQHLPFLTVHHPGPSNTAYGNFTRISEVSSRPSQRKDVNRKCYASLDTKGLMK